MVITILLFSNESYRYCAVCIFSQGALGIENKLNWTLDAAFLEDYTRNR